MIEKQILQALVTNEDYTRQVLPFLKKDYFQQLEYSLVYDVISEYFEKYNAIPKKEALIIDIENKGGVGEETNQVCRGHCV